MAVGSTLKAKGASPGPGAFPRALVAWAVLGMAVDIGLARFTYGVTLPTMREELALDYTTGGALSSVHLVAYLLGTLSVPALARRFGQGRVARAGHLLFAVGAAACAAAPGTALLGIGRLLAGFGAAAGITSVVVMTQNAVEPRLRFAVSAAVWGGIGLAVIGSGALAPVLLAPGYGWRAGFAISALLALLLAAAFPPRTAAAQVAAAPAPSADREPFRAADLLRPQWLFLVAAYTIFGAAYIAYATFTGARLSALGTSIGFVQAIWVAFGLGCLAGSAGAILCFRTPAGARLALPLAFLASAAGAWASTGPTPGAAMAGAVLVGLGMASAPSGITARLRQRTSAAAYAQVFSYATAGLGIGQLLGPVATGALADHYGTIAVPAFAAAAYAAGALMAFADDRARPVPETLAVAGPPPGPP